jgi:uncharacterized membrane protein YdbT with pleckstrin-like domain
MGYIDKTLVPGEQVVYETRLHWIVIVGHIIFGLLLAALGGFLAFYAYRHPDMTTQNRYIFYGVAAASGLVGIIFLIVGSVRRNATEIGVTNRRVVIKTGLTSRRTVEMLLNKIETIEVTETGMGRVLGYGSIQIVGTGGTYERFHTISHPVELRNRVQMEIERLQPGKVEPGERRV